MAEKTLVPENSSSELQPVRVIQRIVNPHDLTQAEFLGNLGLCSHEVSKNLINLKDLKEKSRPKRKRKSTAHPDFLYGNKGRDFPTLADHKKSNKRPLLIKKGDEKKAWNEPPSTTITTTIKDTTTTNEHLIVVLQERNRKKGRQSPPIKSNKKLLTNNRIKRKGWDFPIIKNTMNHQKLVIVLQKGDGEKGWDFPKIKLTNKPINEKLVMVFIKRDAKNQKENDCEKKIRRLPKGGRTILKILN